MAVRRHKEAIHSGHFMVSNFEADEQDEDDIAIPVPSEDSTAEKVPNAVVQQKVQNQFKSFVNLLNTSTVPNLQHSSSLMIDVSLTKLFQCMSIAYRQKLTSPKWNRFLGMKLRWKDKFRLNNVIWRCWHMQFIKGHRKLVCAFANPMELDNHNKTEAGAILEGKYWKRKMNCILSEYQKWRIFYKNQHSWPSRDSNFIADVSNSLESVIRTGKDDIELESLITDHDFFVDALFNSLGSQSVHFQDAERMISNSDFIQPSLNPLQPNLEDLMDLDPMAPLQDWLSSKLPENVEESTPSLPLQNIKDIEVAGTRYHPFSHASLRDVDGFSKPLPVTTVTSNISNTNYIASGDSQPSTSTFSHHHPHSSYSEYNNKKKAPLPGKKLWAIQQCQQQQQQHHQQQSWEQDKSYSEVGPSPLVSSPHVSVIQMSQQHVYPSNTSESATRTNNISQQHVYPSESSESTTRVNNTNQSHVYPGDTSQQHVYSGDTSVRPGLAPPQQRSVIATNPASQQQHQPCKPPAPTYEATYTPSYLTPRAQSYVGAGAGLEPVPVVKNESPELQTPTAQSSELVQLLKSNQQKSKSEPTYRNTRGPGRPSRKHKNAESAEDLSNISGKLKKVVSIPPPPANGLPQPSFTLGSSNSSLLDDTKISSAEQKRRCTIKNGFEYLRTLIPSLSQTPNVKISKAALLAKGAEHVQLLGAENETLGREVEQLRKSVDDLSADITHYQLQLPAAGSAKGRTGSESDRLQYLFDKHVATCTMQNWKYFVFSKLMNPLLDSFDRTVSSSSIEDLARTSGSWMDQHVSLVQLRPLVLNSLKDLSVNTEILSEPHKMPQEALNHVQNIIAPKKEFSSTPSSSNNMIFYENQ